METVINAKTTLKMLIPTDEPNIIPNINSIQAEASRGKEEGGSGPKTTEIGNDSKTTSNINIQVKTSSGKEKGGSGSKTTEKGNGSKTNINVKTATENMKELLISMI